MAFDTAQSAYLDLRQILTEGTDPVIAWIGAGLSTPAGIPAWSGLRDSLVAELNAVASHIGDIDEKRKLQFAAGEANVNRNLWEAFSTLYQNLGEPVYKAAIRNAMRPSDKLPVPPVYQQLWQVGVKGIVNLNIDRFAKRAFNSAFGGRTLHDFVGKDIGHFVHLLRSANPWLAQLHGEVDNSESWVFTALQLRTLFANSGYQQFVNSCLTTRTVVFIGISAEDVAAGGHLARLTQAGIDCGSHFWITHRTDPTVQDWAKQAGLRVIHYASDNGHAELTELLADIESYVSVDVPAPPVTPLIQAGSPQKLLPPNELSTKSSSEIRETLNAYATKILSRGDLASIDEFERFADQYEDAIYRGWRVTTKPPNDRILGYRVIDSGKEGAFGKVFRAENDAGKQFAIKVLHEGIRSNRERLQCFRRGVKSMQILSQEHVPGVVRYYDASEIPATVVMDFIEGIDLEDAMQRGVIKDWQSRLRIALELTKVIRNSHRLPQRVLHRDIRPSNVMLENCWGPNPDWAQVRLFVLDFDLSWHVNALDVSVTQPGTQNGYLAPELAERDSGKSTRHASVDSFGLGMTMYFLGTGTTPRFGEHRYADWIQSLDGCAANNPCLQWQSLPNRFFRLVRKATMDRQEERSDVAQIESELNRLSEALNSPAAIAAAEVLAEEVAFLATHGAYEWNSERLEARLRDSAVTATLRGVERERQLRLSINWIRTGSESHKSVTKWLPNAKSKALAALRNGGWSAKGDGDSQNISFDATMSVDEAVRRGLSEIATTVENAFAAFKF